MTHRGTVLLETERLILRRFVAEDAPAMFRNWAGSEEVTKFLRWPAHSSPDVTQGVLRDWISSYAREDFYQWAIVPKKLGEPIGTISVVEMDEKIEKLHIGYCIGSSFWHQGYTSEAFSGILPFLFEEVGAGRVESQHDPENPYSGAVMKKCGLRYEGTLRRADWNNRGIVDACLYALLREDYEKLPGKR
ncbi:MAG: GNAT family N-acetyltransferase [Provencibacterium sp.]|nr:GNAT family N-acetyltransferase [Provencibacterium sp.]